MLLPFALVFYLKCFVALINKCLPKSIVVAIQLRWSSLFCSHNQFLLPQTSLVAPINSCCKPIDVLFSKCCCVLLRYNDDSMTREWYKDDGAVHLLNLQCSIVCGDHLVQQQKAMKFSRHYFCKSASSLMQGASCIELCGITFKELCVSIWNLIERWTNSPPVLLL